MASLARKRGVERGRRISALDGPQGALVRLHRHPVVQLGSRPLDPFVGAQLSDFRRTCSRAAPMASSRTPTITEVNIVATNGPAARMIGSSPPFHASRTAGAPSSRMAWLCVAAIPMPSHSAVKLRPALPSHGRPPTSSTKTVGSDSPSGIAVVIIRSVIPNPLPKCLSPVTAYDRPARNGCASVGVAIDRVRAMSPPLPGSDVIVPHCSPAAALAKTACRCSSQSGCDGSDVESQNPITVGCIVDTRATDGSADARRR